MLRRCRYNADGDALLYYIRGKKGSYSSTVEFAVSTDGGVTFETVENGSYARLSKGQEIVLKISGNLSNGEGIAIDRATWGVVP